MTCTVFSSRYHGLIPTDKGSGLVIDIVHDSDGSVSPSLLNFVQSDPATNRPRALAMVDDLQSFVLKNDFRFLFSFNPKHLLVQNRDGKTRLVLADWKGRNHEFIPISSWCSCFARAKARRRFNRLREWIHHATENKA